MKISSSAFILFILLHCNLYAQLLVKNQTFSGFGSGITQDVVGVKIQQSIGQSSVIGNFQSGEVKINQGFLRGFFLGLKNSSESIVVTPYPNPFKSRITFRFIPSISEEVALTIYDLYGRRVANERLIILNNEVTVDLGHLSNALYLVNLRLGNQFFQTRIVKNL
jgi:hypothetical protein